MIAWYAQFSEAVVHWSIMTAWYMRFCAGSTGLVNDMTAQYARSVRVSTDLANDDNVVCVFLCE